MPIPGLDFVTPTQDEEDTKRLYEHRTNAAWQEFDAATKPMVQPLYRNALAEAARKEFDAATLPIVEQARERQQLTLMEQAKAEFDSLTVPLVAAVRQVDDAPDPNVISTPLPALRQNTPGPAANPWGTTQGAATFGETDDTRAGLPESPLTTAPAQEALDTRGMGGMSNDVASAVGEAGQAVGEAFAPLPSVGPRGSGEMSLGGISGIMARNNPALSPEAAAPVMEGVGEGLQRTGREAGTGLAAVGEGYQEGDAGKMGLGAFQAAGAPFSAAGNVVSESAQNLGADPMLAEGMGAVTNFATPWGGASTLANLRNMGRVGQLAVSAMGMTGAGVGGKMAYDQAKAEGKSDEEAWQAAAVGAINGADAGLGIGEMGRAVGGKALSAVGRQVDEAGGLVPWMERGELRLPGGADDAAAGVPAAAPAEAAPSTGRLSLSEAGEAERSRLIAANVKLGFGEDAATQMVDGYITKLHDTHKVPENYLAVVDEIRAAAAKAVAPPTEASSPASGAVTGAAGADLDAKPLTGLDKALDVANRVRYSGMLSNPVGGLADVISNGFNIPVHYNRVFQAALMEGVGERLGKLQPHERSASLDEVRAMNAGFTSGITQGMREALDLLVQGGTPVRAEQPQGVVGGPIGLLLEGGQRLRIAADALTQHIGESMATNALAAREARREGLKGGAPAFAQRAAVLAAGIKTKLAQGEVPQLGTLPTRGMDDAAKVDQLAGEVTAWAKRSVFQANLGTSAKAVDESRAAPVVRFMVPFFRTLANLGAQAATMTPGLGQAGIAADLGAAKAFGKGAYAAGNAFTTSNTPAVLPASQRLADANLGVMVAATGGALVASGLMVGAPPRDQRLRDAWYAAGNRPYALKLRDTQVPIERMLGPLAVPLVFGASLMDSYLANGQEVDPAMLTEFANSAQREWFDASGLRAFHDLLSNARNGLFNRTATQTAARTVTSFVPSGALIRAIANATDDVQRAPTTFLDFVKEGLPMLREQIPAREDELGQPIRRPSGQRGPGAFSPIQPSRAADNVTGLDRDIQAAKREAMRDLEDDPKFQRLPAKEQAAARTRIVSAVSRRYTDQRKSAVSATLLPDHRSGSGR